MLDLRVHCAICLICMFVCNFIIHQLYTFHYHLIASYFMLCKLGLRALLLVSKVEKKGCLSIQRENKFRHSHLFSMRCSCAFIFHLRFVSELQCCIHLMRSYIIQCRLRLYIIRLNFFSSSFDSLKKEKNSNLMENMAIFNAKCNQMSWV